MKNKLEKGKKFTSKANLVEEKNDYKKNFRDFSL